MSHLMDVARIAYITCLEQNLGIEKDVIYGAAILHDIGKYAQYDQRHEQFRQRKAALPFAQFPYQHIF